MVSPTIGMLTLGVHAGELTELVLVDALGATFTCDFPGLGNDSDRTE
jgi:hypothetical protein